MPSKRRENSCRSRDADVVAVAVDGHDHAATLNVGQHISSQHCDEGIVLPKLSFVCQSLRSGFSNANSAHEKAMMVDEG